MTPVQFRFITPTGDPVANTAVQIQLSRSGFDDVETGIVMPRLVVVNTDEDGAGTVELWPSTSIYHVEVMDGTSEVGLHYKFYVPALDDPEETVRLQDIVIDSEISPVPYDEAAILIIVNAKANALAAQAGAAASAVTATTQATASAASAAASLASEVAAGASEDASAASQAAAATSAGNAAASAVAADTSADASQASASAAFVSEGAAAASESAAALSETNAAASEAMALSTLAVFDDEPPLNPLPGRRWTSKLTGKTYEWIEDGTSEQWVETGSAPTVSSTAIAAALASSTGAAAIGTTDGTVQAAINARPTSAALAASGGAGLVGYDGGTSQDVLDNAKTLQDYTALRAYTGRATGARITTSGVAGTFWRDASDTTSADNGGTIIVDASGRRWKRFHAPGVVNVAWFGVDVLGVTDATTAVNAALAYLAASPTMSSIGVGEIELPKGILLLNGTVSYGALTAGLIFRGAGNGATVIKRTLDSGSVFSFTPYSRIRFEDMSFSHVTGTAYTTWTNVLFNMNGTGGGNQFQLKNVTTDGFGHIVKYNASPSANEDTNSFENCRFNNFKIFLYCLSSQAVINNFRNCSFFGTCESVFHINGFGCTHLDTCNIVVSGKVYDIYGGGPTATYVNTNCKLEFWPQGGAVGTTQLIKMNAAANVYFSFRGGGFTSSTGPDTSVNQLELMLTSGQILFDGGIWDNRIKIKTYDSMPTSVFGTQVVNAYTKFSGCSQSPSPANVTFDNSGVSPSYAGVVWENCNDRTNLCLTGISNGAAYNSTVPAASVINRNTFTGSPSGGVIMNGSTATTFPVPHHGQLAFLRSVQVLVHSQGNVASGLISVFADAAKTITIATLALTAGVSTTPKLYNVTIPADTVVSEGVYVEIKNANGVFVYGRVYVETMSI